MGSWKAVDDGDTATYLADAAASSQTLTAGLTLWVVGVLLLGLGGALLSSELRGTGGLAARFLYGLGPALAVPGFIAMAAVIRLAGSADPSLAVADALAFVGVRLDDVATILLLGLAPVAVAVGGRDTWVPRWLRRFSAVTAACALAAAVSMFTGDSATVGFVIVPVGVIWSISAGVAAVRYAGRSPSRA